MSNRLFKIQEEEEIENKFEEETSAAQNSAIGAGIDLRLPKHVEE